MKKNTPKVPQKPAPPARAETRKGRQDDSNTALWRPPLQRHLTKDKKVHHITIRVRIFAGDIIHDFNAKFQPSKHLPAQAVCDVIAKREGLSDHAKTMFALWVVGRDLELQLRPNLNLFDFIPKWHVWMQKYTHLPECKTATHPTNRHWFVFRREALFSKTLERKVTEENAIKLFYGEAKHNVTSGRYPCTEEDVVTLAALQLQSATGDHDSSKHYTGYLTGENVLEQYIPAYMIKKLSRHDWEVAIFDEHLKFKGKSSAIAKLLWVISSTDSPYC
ncbi:FERM central domain-containing protein [Cladochytrium replicatum]|nr:FERM central domain-containing protein [Cladochytrium replicatum]